MTKERYDAWRLYSIANGLYMKEIQWGIQTAHGISTMMDKTSEGLINALTNKSLGKTQREAEQKAAMEKYMKVHDWALNCPTIIICDGLNVAGLLQAKEIAEMYADGLGLPFAVFNEDQDSLGGIITNVSMLIPQEYFAATPKFDEERNVYAYTLMSGVDVHRGASGKNGWTFTLVDYIKNLRLVR